MAFLCRSHATHDLFNAISAGDYPEWDLQIQTMDPKDELSFDFDPLDATKVQVLTPPVMSPRLPEMQTCLPTCVAQSCCIFGSDGCRQ